MFGFGKKKTVAKVEGSNDLPQRPFTKALLATSLGIRQTLHEQLYETGLKLNEPFDPEPIELDRRIGLAIQIVPPHIVRETVEHLGRTADFLPLPVPDQHLPKDAPAFMVFARVAAMSLYVGVNREGFSLPLAPFTADLPRSVFYGWPSKETNLTLDVTTQLYEMVMKNKTSEISEWIESCYKVVLGYVDHYANKPEAEQIIKGCSIMVTQIARAIHY